MVTVDATRTEARDSERRYVLISGKEHSNPIKNVDAVNIYAGPYFNLVVDGIHYAEPYFSLVVDAIHVRHIASINFGRDYEAYFETGTARDKIKDLFYDLAGEWKAATAFMSSATDIAMHPAYQKIIGMGREAVPLILQELQQNTDHWFWALKSIVGIDPVPSKDKGNIGKMRDAWIAWGLENGLI